MVSREKPRTKAGQDRKVARVMHEFKEGDLKRPDGETVTDRRQAVAIALSEAGLSWRDRARKAGRTARTVVGAVASKAGKAAGHAGRALRNGAARVAANVRGRFRSRPSDSATASVSPPRSNSASDGPVRKPASRGASSGATRAAASRADLYLRAQQRGIAGRSRMSKSELERALSH